jgi:hypothetical protein
MARLFIHPFLLFLALNFFWLGALALLYGFELDYAHHCADPLIDLSLPICCFAIEHIHIASCTI